VKRKRAVSRSPSLIYDRIRQILDSAGSNVARSANTTQVITNCLIGREIVEEEQAGEKRAGYGEALLQDLSDRLTRDFGRGWSVRQLEYVRSFYLEYKFLLNPAKSNAVRANSGTMEISSALGANSVEEKGDAPSSRSWRPGLLHPNLSWTHCRTLLRVDKPDARAFYEIEAIKNNWAAQCATKCTCPRRRS